MKKNKIIKIIIIFIIIILLIVGGYFVYNHLSTTKENNNKRNYDDMIKVNDNIEISEEQKNQVQKIENDLNNKKDD